MPGSWSAVLSGVSGTLVAGVGVSSSAAAAALSTASFGCGIEAPDYRMLVRRAQSLEIRSRGRKRQTLSAGRNRVEVLPQCVKGCGEKSRFTSPATEDCEGLGTSACPSIHVAAESARQQCGRNRIRGGRADRATPECPTRRPQRCFPGCTPFRQARMHPETLLESRLVRLQETQAPDNW